MNNEIFLKNLFQAYYQDSNKDIQAVSMLDRREFGFLLWDNQFMQRHLGFLQLDDLRQFLIKNSPKHAYSSGSLYSRPDDRSMENKGYQGCDFVIDIDVDHFYTECKNDHDLWYCKECGKDGKGMIEKCPECEKLKITRIAWICDKCLDIAKKEIMKLIDNFLIPDFALNVDQMNIAFSGHRGYHLKIEDSRIRTLTSDQRREIVDYLTGENISFEILGLHEKSSGIFGLLKDNQGWANKIMAKLEEILHMDSLEIEHFLRDPHWANLTAPRVNSLLNYREDFLEIINSKNRNIWSIEGFGLTTWKQLLRAVVKKVGAEIDEPVSIDIHRLIRYPGTLHGKTGFKVQELEYNQLDEFNPLDESNELIDPIVFKSKKQITQKLEITGVKVPATKIKGETYGDYDRGEKIEVPHHVAVFLLCKGVAKII
ncbi:MAG: DNA primase small subunit domain-containing protein [Promethearchaeota archaeon]